MRTLNKFVQIRSVWLAIILCLGQAIPAYAATIFSEDYEVAGTADLAAQGWGLAGNVAPNACNVYCSITIVNAPAGLGRTGRVMRMEYRGVQSYMQNGVLIFDDSHNAHLSVYFPPTPDMYVRYYFMTQPIPPATQSGYGPVAAKQHYLKIDGTTFDNYPNAVVNHFWGNRSAEIGVQNDVGSPPGNDVENMASVPLQDNKWYCIEYHIKMNTPDLANGVVELWVDGRQTIGYYSRNFRDTAHAGAAFTKIEVYRQGSDNMYRYEDDFVVATTRVGCSGNPSADITPPMPPIGLTFGP